MKCTGEEAIGVGQAMALAPDDMVFPTYRQQGLLDRARLAAARHDVPVLFELPRPPQGPAIAGAVFVEGSLVLLDLRQSRHPIPAGGRLGDGVGAEGRPPHRRRLDRRGLDRRARFPPRADLRLGLSRAGDPERRQQPVGDLLAPGDRRRRGGDLRVARDRLRPRLPPGRRQRFPGGVRRDAMGGGAGPRQPGRDADRVVHLPRRGAFDERRPEPLPSRGRRRATGPTATRSSACRAI